MKATTLLLLCFCAAAVLATSVTEYDYTTGDCSGTSTTFTYTTGECMNIQNTFGAQISVTDTTAKLCVWLSSTSCAGNSDGCSTLTKDTCNVADDGTSYKLTWTGSAASVAVSGVALFLAVAALLF